MSITPILVLPDAGCAGRVLLGRRDLDIRWALTVEEAVAVLGAGLELRACLVREEMAVELLDALKSQQNAPPVIVLVEPEGWERRESFFALGATALVRASSPERILEAISELTGQAFRTCPRVSFTSVIDAEIEGETTFVETVDLSVSGVSVRGIKNPKVGLRADLNFVMCDPPVTVTAMLVRTHEELGELVAGMCFVGLDDERRGAIAQLVAREEARAMPLPEPVGFTSDLSGLGPFTMDLRESVGSGDDADQVYANMLREVPAQGNKLQLPSWLRRLESELTALEWQAIFEGDVPRWARASLLLRIHLKRTRLDAPVDVTPAQIARVAEHCCVMAAEAAGSSSEELAQVTAIRTALLREVYEPRRAIVESASAQRYAAAPTRSDAPVSRALRGDPR